MLTSANGITTTPRRSAKSISATGRSGQDKPIPLFIFIFILLCGAGQQISLKSEVIRLRETKSRLQISFPPAIRQHPSARCCLFFASIIGRPRCALGRLGDVIRDKKRFCCVFLYSNSNFTPTSHQFSIFSPIFAESNRAPPCPAAPVSGTLLPLLRIFPGNPGFYLFFPTGGVPPFFAALPSPAAAGNKGAFFRQVTIILFTPSRQPLPALPPLFSIPEQCETIAIFPKISPCCPRAAFILLNSIDIPQKLKRNTSDCSAVLRLPVSSAALLPPPALPPIGAAAMHI